MEKVTVFKTNVREIEDLIFKHYNYRHEILPSEEANSDDSLDISIDGIIDDYDARKIKKALDEGQFIMYGTRALMNKLCADGHIEAGNYIVRC